jgi:hypothetical protein
VFRVSECFGLFRVFRAVISGVSDVPEDIVLRTVSVISNQVSSDVYGVLKLGVGGAITRPLNTNL